MYECYFKSLLFTADAAEKAMQALEQMELETLLNGKYDRNNAIILGRYAHTSGRAYRPSPETRYRQHQDE